MKPLSEVKFIVVHAADSKENMNVTVDTLKQWHVVENGWPDIGYHYFIKFDGSRYTCRSAAFQGAHCVAVNDKSLAVCLEGGFGGVDNFTESQKNQLFNLITALKIQNPNAAVIGHNHIDDKPCPCFDVTAWYEDKLKENTGIFGGL